MTSISSTAPYNTRVYDNYDDTTSEKSPVSEEKVQEQSKDKNPVIISAAVRSISVLKEENARLKEELCVAKSDNVRMLNQIMEQQKEIINLQRINNEQAASFKKTLDDITVRQLAAEAKTERAERMAQIAVISTVCSSAVALMVSTIGVGAVIQLVGCTGKKIAVGVGIMSA